MKASEIKIDPANLRFIFPENDDDFGGYYLASELLTELGFSVGSMCSSEPTAIKFGEFQIAKWKNLTEEERVEIDGTLKPVHGVRTFRNGPLNLAFKTQEHFAKFEAFITARA